MCMYKYVYVCTYILLSRLGALGTLDLGFKTLPRKATTRRGCLAGMLGLRDRVLSEQHLETSVQGVQVRQVSEYFGVAQHCRCPGGS